MANEDLETVHLISEGVECIPQDSTSVQIFIKDVDTKTITLEVASNCTIQKIKELINNKKNIAIKQQMIIFKGKELENELDLSHYNITNNSVLNLVKYQQLNEPIREEEEKQPTTLDMNPLAKILKTHGLYDDLYSILNENGIDLGILENDLRENDIDTLCDEFGLNIKQKLKFRKLTRIIHKQNNPDSQMTVVLIGDIDAGKTCLIHKYAENTYSNNYTSTVGVGFMMKQETLSDDSMMTLKIWDTAGQERFQSVCRGYYRRADCIILCYDVSKKTPFQNCEKWREQIDKYGDDNVIVIVVGCKSDIINDMSQVNVAKAQSIIEQPKWEKFKAIHCECSAKTGDNVENVFVTAAELVLMNRPKNKGKDGVIDQLQKAQEQQPANKWSCC